MTDQILTHTLTDADFASSRHTTPKGFIFYRFIRPGSAQEVAIMVRTDDDLTRIRVNTITFEGYEGVLFINALNIGEGDNVVLSIGHLNVEHGGLLILGPRPLTLTTLTLRHQGSLVHAYSVGTADGMMDLRVDRALIANSALIAAKDDRTILEVSDSTIENAIIPVLDETTIHSSSLIAQGSQTLVCRGNLISRHVCVPDGATDSKNYMIIDQAMPHGIIPVLNNETSTIDTTAFGQVIDSLGKDYFAAVFNPNTPASEPHLSRLEGSPSQNNVLMRFMHATLLEHDGIIEGMSEYEKTMIQTAKKSFCSSQSLGQEHDQPEDMKLNTALDLSAFLDDE